MADMKPKKPNAADWLGDLSGLQRSHDGNPEPTTEMPPPPVKRFSDFEDGMLAAARDLNQDEDLRRKVAKRLS